MANDAKTCCGACEHAARVEKNGLAAPPSLPIAVRFDDAGVPVGIALVISGRAPVVVPISKRRVVIGRAKTADISIEDSTLSRLTCALEIAPDGSVFVEDLQSSCGTYVNGQKVKRSGLHEKDQIHVGGCVLEFRLTAP